MYKLLEEFQHHGQVALQLRYTPEGDSAAQILEIPENGYLGELKSGKVEIELIAGIDFRSFSSYTLSGKGSDGKWKVDFKPYTETRVLINNQETVVKSYKLVVPIRIAENKPFKGIPNTLYPGNTMRFLLLKNDGQIETWTIAVFSQMGKFFCCLQKKYDTTCYREENGKISCYEFRRPEYQNMLGFLEYRFKMCGKAHQVPSVKFFKKPLKNDNESRLPDNQARIQWFTLGEGLGLADVWVGPKKVTARVYWRQIKKRDNGPIRVLAGEIVKFKRLVQNNRSVRHGSSVEYYLEGVEPLNFK